MEFFERKYVDGKNASALGAFSVNKTVEFVVQLPRRLGAVDVYMHLYGEGLENHKYMKFKLFWQEIDGENDIYSCKIDMSKIGIGLYYYKYEIQSGEVFFLGEGKRENELSKIENDSGLIQLTVFKEEKRCIGLFVNVNKFPTIVNIVRTAYFHCYGNPRSHSFQCNFHVHIPTCRNNNRV